MITEITKRNGQKVSFAPEKITQVLQKAFTSTVTPASSDMLTQMTDRVVARLHTHCGDVQDCPTVELVQDLVEQTLMERGYFDVAKHFILYRYKQTEKRQEQVTSDIDENRLMVERTDGTMEQFSRDMMVKYLSSFIYGYEKDINVESVINQLEKEIYSGIRTKDLSKLVTLILRARIESDPAYSYVAGRQLNARILDDAWGITKHTQKESEYTKAYRGGFVENMKKMVEAGKLVPELLKFDLAALAGAIEPSRDDLFMYLGIETLHDRYFIQVDKKVLETPQTMFMRIAMGLALNEKDKEARAVEFYNIMSTLRFVPSTPTLFHAGTMHPQLSSCYLNTVEDDLDHIFKVFGDNANLAKWAGGIGTAWSALRGTGAYIKRGDITSQGVIPFLKIANDATIAINRSGRRRGAACVYIENWHYDFLEFLELRKNTGDERRRTHDLNTATWVSDLFMKRVRDDGEWTLFSPEETPELTETYGKKFEDLYTAYEAKAKRGEMRLTNTMSARVLWKKMLGMLFETGHPWITFKDPSNIRSPQDHAGVVHSSNLCTEITLNTSKDETAVCNLGSLNYPIHMVDGKLSESMVRETVRTAMRMLDNVIDINFYPTKEAKYSNLKHRPVGLGVMGYHDALYIQNIPFDSEAAIRFSDTSMELIAHSAILASSELAEERGSYDSFNGSKWDRGILPQDTIALLEKERGIGTGTDMHSEQDWDTVRDRIKKHGMRNSNCMAIAPTATISNIVGSIPGIEPIYKNIYVKSNISGDFIVVNTYLIESLKNAELWTNELRDKIKLNDGSIQSIDEIPDNIKELFKETFEIDMRWLVRSAAVRGKWIDQSQSLNIFYAGTSGKEISDLYMYAWELGLKTTYYLRTLSASQVEKSTVSDSGTQLRTNKAAENTEADTVAEATKIAIAPTIIAEATSPIITSKLNLHVAEDALCESCQ